MQTRRSFLSQVAAIALGGSLLNVGATATGRPSGDEDQQSASQSTTELTVSGDPAIVGQIGLPAVPGVSFGTIGRYAAIVSPGDVDHIAGKIETRDGQLSGGSGTAIGSFDVRSIATDLQRHTAFSRINRTKGSNSTGTASGFGVTVTASSADRHREARESPSELLARVEPASVLVLEPSRINLAVDATRTAAAERLARWRRRSTRVGGSTRGEVDTASAQDSVVTAHVSLDEPMRRRLLDVLPSSPERLRRFVRSIQEAGVAIQGNAAITELRYTFSLDDNPSASQAFVTLLADLRAHEGVRLVDQSVSSSVVTAHVSIPTDSLWTVHRSLLGV
ncbi:hypothetical protein HSR122_0217 [Halapricum desulfuricans]|uniref:Uncharacterized protein n=1 Tax=Halapricum desulfuricans TaxID=2841257 RepID=A0A897N4T2_9EURY|nr:hypothetical protein HSR122_0217 [Halapricum desulfuricans]